MGSSICPSNFLQVTYRVIQVADGQLEAQADGATAVSVVTGFPATTQPVTQVEISYTFKPDIDEVHLQLDH